MLLPGCLDMIVVGVDELAESFRVGGSSSRVCKRIFTLSSA